MIVLTAATKQEIDGICQGIVKKPEITSDGHSLWQGVYKDRQVLIVQTGIGRSSAERAISSILASYPVTALISFGFGGALTRELAVGDVVLCTTIRCLNGGGDDWLVEPYHTNTYLFQRAIKALVQSGLNWLPGKGVTVSKPASHAEEKRSLGDRLRAEVCEMEDYWIARMAGARQIPFLAVRVIYDELTTTLLDFEKIVDSAGNLSLNRAVPYLLTHPVHLLQMPTLYRRSNRAQESLSTFVNKFLDIL